MSNRWLSSGRYGLTRGVFKRFWNPSKQLSEVIIPRVSKLPPSPGGVERNLLTELSEQMLTEAEEEILVENA